MALYMITFMFATLGTGAKAKLATNATIIWRATAVSVKGKLLFT